MVRMCKVVKFIHIFLTTSLSSFSLPPPYFFFFLPFSFLHTYITTDFCSPSASTRTPARPDYPPPPNRAINIHLIDLLIYLFICFAPYENTIYNRLFSSSLSEAEGGKNSEWGYVFSLGLGGIEKGGYVQGRSKIPTENIKEREAKE